MNYTEATAYKKTIEQRGMILGLESITALLDALGNPQDALKFIHVAGTNGKGSVIAYLSEILTRCGYRIGAYTSPAVFQPLEIYRVNGIPMQQDTYAGLMETIREVLPALQKKGICPTAFEIDTAIAFLYFYEQQCDLVLLETGLGGALDATNCITNTICAVLTSIGMDHMKILGGTLEAIAAAKAGIIKPGCDVVSAAQPPEVLEVLREACAKQDTELTVVAAEKLKVSYDEKKHCYFMKYKQFPEVVPGIAGKIQTENAALVLEVLEKLKNRGYDLPQRQIADGFAKTCWQGRMMELSHEPYIILDGAHNEPAVKQLMEEIREHFRDRRWFFVMGVLADKDYQTMARYIVPCAEKILTVTPDSPRALEKEALADVLCKAGGDAAAADSIPAAVREAVAWCDTQDKAVLVFGSFTFLEEARRSVQQAMPLVERIMKHPLFLQKMKQIEEVEKERIFCRHGWEHCLDVARVSALLNEERKLGFSKQMLYALALIHDLGRADQYLEGIPHEEAGVEIAKQILPQCGFDAGQTDRMLGAIRHHRADAQDADPLTKLLVEADKKTRLCFACEARETCKWPEAKRNRTIHL